MNDNDTSFAVVNAQNMRAGHYFTTPNRITQQWSTETGFRIVAQDLTHEQATALKDLLNASE